MKLNGKTILPEEKYEIAYKNEMYKQRSVGAAYISWVLHTLKFKSVLDVGCGMGYGLLAFLLHNKYAKGMEVCDELLHNSLRTYVEMGVVKKGRIQQMPYNNDEFDLLYSTDVLEHIPECDVHQALSEMVRVTKGQIFVSVCTIPSRILPELKLHETVKPMEWWDEQFSQFRLRTTHNEAIAQMTDGTYKVREGDGFVRVFKKY